MDRLKMDTDSICMDTAALFRARDKLARDIAELDKRIVSKRNAYRDAMRVKGFSVDHMRQACRMRGLL